MDVDKDEDAVEMDIEVTTDVDDVAVRVAQAYYEGTQVPAGVVEALRAVNGRAWKLAKTASEKCGVVIAALDACELEETDYGCLAQAFVAAFEAKAVSDSKERLASLDYRIANQRLSHLYDLKRFIEQVLETAGWYCQSRKEQDAPYFCAIQSSGMGKTKIMYEACKVLASRPDESDQPEKWCCQLVLPTKVQQPPSATSSSVFKHKIDFGVIAASATLEHVVTESFDKLDKLLTVTAGDEKPDNVLLCFDEAQAFLETTELQTESGAQEIQALFFRIIRLWLRVKRNIKVVACFAGTTASLNGFRFENDSQLLTVPPSRDWQKNKRNLHDKGCKFFPVFTQTTTIGCIAKHDGTGTEYERAIRYGRPLFALLDVDSKLDGRLPNVLGRMLLSEKTWEDSLPACLSILATRVQMGQTTFPIASQLVSKGYANLTSVATGTAQICYMPDPVCARLAMLLMDSTFVMGPFKGKGKKWWVDKMAQIFCQGLCNPEKGDVGEVMVAFYLLLCGDTLRTSDTFSVPLLDWIHSLQSGGQPVPGAASESAWPRAKKARSGDEHPVAKPNSSRKSKRIAEKMNSVKAPAKASGSGKGVKATVSFIQVCRNNLRSSGWDWAGFSDQIFLKYLYESVTACYVFAGCPLIDMVASMKITTEMQPVATCFAPLLFSIKSHYFGPADAAFECERMVNEARRSECKQALCILVVFGSPAVSDDGGWALDDTAIEEMLGNNVVARVLRIPFNDSFSVTDTFVKVTSGAVEIGEIFASHPFIRAHHSSPEELSPEYALRESAGTKAKEMLETLAVELR